MTDCICLPRCIFYNDHMANMPHMADIMKSRYCRGDFARCARYQVFKALGREHVPGDLFPNDQDRVKALLDQSPSPAGS